MLTTGRQLLAALVFRQAVTRYKVVVPVSVRTSGEKTPILQAADCRMSEVAG